MDENYKFWLDDESHRRDSLSEARQSHRFPQASDIHGKGSKGKLSSSPYNPPQHANNDKVINLRLSLPSNPIKRLLNGLRRLTAGMLRPKKIKYGFLPLCAVLIASWLAYSSFSGTNNGNTDVSTAEAAQKSGLKPLVPANKIAPDQSKTLNSTYDKEKQLFSYTDIYEGAHFTVSQQLLPASFKNDDGAFKNAANAVGAKQELETSRGTVYLGKIEKQNVQLAVMKTKTQLLFIQSSTILEDYFWVKYINNLQVAESSN